MSPEEVVRAKLDAWATLNVAVNDSLVMVERVDRFIYDGNDVSARCMGAFEVVGDKIIAWRDYVDMPERYSGGAAATTDARCG